MTLKLRRFEACLQYDPCNYPKFVLFPLRTAIFGFNLVRGAFAEVS